MTQDRRWCVLSGRLSDPRDHRGKNESLRLAGGEEPMCSRPVVTPAEARDGRHRREIYHAENGDGGCFCRDDDGRVFVLHRPMYHPAERRRKSSSESSWEEVSGTRASSAGWSNCRVDDTADREGGSPLSSGCFPCFALRKLLAFPSHAGAG